MYPDGGYGIVIGESSHSVRVFWFDGTIDSIWKITLEAVNGSR